MDPIKNYIPEIIAGFQSPEKKIRAQLTDVWSAIAGPKIAAHTKPQLSKSGVLSVWVDQPALAYELGQKYRRALLKRAQTALGNQNIKSVRFFVGQLR